MIQHKHLWDAIDALAHVKGYSTSGLAKKAGLDSTIFNKSKRISNDGRLRWPTTQSIVKILDTAEYSMGKFATLIQNAQMHEQCLFLPMVALSNIQEKCCFIDNKGQIIDSEKANFEKNTNIDGNVFIVKVDSNNYLPTYDKNDLLMVSRGSGIRKMDKIFIATKSGKNILAIVKSLTSHTVKILPIGKMLLARDEVPIQEIAWMARILWKSEF